LTKKFNDRILSYERGLLQKFNEFATSLQRNLDRSPHFGGELRVVEDTLELYNNLLQNFMTNEAADRKNGDDNLKACLENLQEKVELFKIEFDDITHCLWDGIEKHTHSIEIDDLVDVASPTRGSPRLSSPHQRLQAQSTGKVVTAPVARPFKALRRPVAPKIPNNLFTTTFPVGISNYGPLRP